MTKNEMLEKIKADELLNSFIKELSSEQLETNLHLIYMQALANEKCKACMGKIECSQDDVNCESFLSLEYGTVYRHVTPCKYIPSYNFDLVDIMYLPSDTFKGEFYKSIERKEFLEACKDILDGKTRKGIYLHGKYGTGKSYLEYNFVNRLAKDGKKVVFCLVPELIQTIKSNLSVFGFLDNLIVKLKNADVLVLDDLGGEVNSGFTRDEILFPILNSRMNDKKKLTFATSNLSFTMLEEHFAKEKDCINDLASGRIMERIRSIMIEMELSGESYRK